MSRPESAKIRSELRALDARVLQLREQEHAISERAKRSDPSRLVELHHALGKVTQRRLAATSRADALRRELECR